MKNGSKVQSSKPLKVSEEPVRKSTYKTIDIKTEIRAVCSLFDGNSEVSHFLLAELDSTYFGYKPARAILKRAKSLFAKRGKLPSCKTEAQDVALTEQSQIILQRFDKKDAIPTKTDAEACIEVLKHWRVKRKFVNIATLVKDAFETGSDDEEGIATLSAAVDQEIISLKSAKDVKLYTVGNTDNSYADSVVEEILYGTEKNLLPSGYDSFDRIAGGWGRGNLIILAASSGGGKSTVAMQSAINVYLKHKKSPAIISLEMDEKEYFERVLACISGVDYAAIREQKMTPSQRKKTEDAWKAFRKHGRENNCVFTVFPVNNISSTEMRARLVTGGYDYWYIDYLNLLNPEDFEGQEAKQLGDMARFLKNTAGELKIAVVALTQISDDFRVKYSRAVREHANFVLKWKYDEDAEASHLLKIVFDKGRGSKREDFYLREDFPYMSVTDHNGVVEPRASNSNSEKDKSYKKSDNDEKQVRRMKRV